MRYYVASSLNNADNVRALHQELRSRGHQITCDWTRHGFIKDEGQRRYYANVEIVAVQNCEQLVVLLPGGRGTHVEMGIAIGCHKRIHLIGETGPKPCIFYYDIQVTQYGTTDEFLRTL